MAIKSSISFYPVNDINITADFYLNIIGLKLSEDMGNAKIFDTGYGYWGFVQYEDRKASPNGLCLSLNCEDNLDVDAFYNKITKKGVATLGEPKMHAKFPVYSFFLNDPNGYLLEFQKIQNA